MIDTFTIDADTDGEVNVSTGPPAPSVLRVVEWDAPPPTPRTVGAAAREGSIVTGDGWENREVTIKIGINRDTDTDADDDLSALLSAVAKLQREKGLLRLSRAARTVDFDVETVTTTGGRFDLTYYLSHATEVELRFTCRPFARGSERQIGLGALGAFQRMLAITDLTVPGDVEALGRIEITSPGGALNRDVIAVAVDSPDVATKATGIQLTASTRAPGAGASTSILYPGLGGVTTSQMVSPAPAAGMPSDLWQPAVSLNEATLVNPVAVTGSFMVFARARVAVAAGASPVGIRLQWSDGSASGGGRGPEVQVPVGDSWQMIPLGVVTPTTGGLWGWIERHTADMGTLVIETIHLVPTDLFLEAQASGAAPPETPVAADGFDQNAATLVGRTAPQGGTWSVSGTAPYLTDGHLRSTTRWRAGLPVAAASLYRLGAMHDYYLDGGLWVGNLAGIDQFMNGGTHAAGSWVVVVFRTWTGSKSYVSLYIRAKNAAGTVTQDEFFTSSPIGSSGKTLMHLSIVDGVAHTILWDRDSNVQTGYNHPLKVAIPGSGMYAGLVDGGNGSNTDSFWCAIPKPADHALFSGKTARLTHAEASRVDADNRRGPIARPVGDRILLPPSGRAGDLARVVVATASTPFGAGPDLSPTDPFSVAVYATPRYLQIPDANA